MSGPSSFASVAWLLEGLTQSFKGRLEYSRGRLRMKTGDRGHAFDVAMQDVTEVQFPWYYFGGGLKLRVGGRQYRLSFVRPNGVESGVARAAGEAGNPLSLLLAVLKFSDIRAGRALTRQWRAIFRDTARS